MAVTWALSDGRAGNARQAEALARALQSEAFQPIHLHAQPPWCWTAPRLLPGTHAAFGAAFARQLQQPPALAIGCGRQAALATRLLRARGSRSVQILDPRLNARHWDLLIVPEHDALRGANVLTLLGSLHPVDDAWLADGRGAFPALGRLPGPRMALLVGGPTAQVPWTTQELTALCTPLREQLRTLGGSLLVTVSRRTPPAALAPLRAACNGLPHLLWCDDRDGPNPYAGLLGWADAIMASADSVNLLSEACATRVPVAAAFAERAQGRVATYVRALQSHGRLGDAADVLVTPSHLPPVRETQRIAALVRQRLHV
ncbi:mitochondrial fission ELM1 family protein [Xanthomonas vesicatoria]|uniref:Mitochondrial fission ELM1 family protein n=4 Tax=Xanthomonas vesicatoria TaxID=56460 RepID=A0AAJ0IWF3_9XANT|nr:ELM1/GtrOC1 family putative glycosyltransferase [Xanthomonas vesicatoria]APO97464.1 nucleoside-diphosphate sugar epimerase [Xanthomonas vesicatoria]APP76391.1 nucleoside-diphosphate sugar epimerase [Xanthomonas vesicatoria ATCC 35937]EGD08159.1 putative nucleoside-diphosphate-sugar epimerase [Xanthomonas vesicatoria ATCC 35937]KHM92510.1 nucleoside-diphosphate sugar epimerase [Xanthomonas vesicatoria]KHM92693.1 nucleoside-diphosphate sugar epimerase [Xanthomonas vesicatoria]